MPLGNLTSQFFANVYLNELDQFIKHKLKANYYIRYVDDFMLLHKSKSELEEYKFKISDFLKNNLDLELHPEKSKTLPIKRGTEFLGLRIFPHHKLIKKKNLKKFQRKFSSLYSKYNRKEVDYDNIYNFMEGWTVYSKNANTFKLRTRMLKEFEEKFKAEISSKEISRYLKTNSH